MKPITADAAADTLMAMVSTKSTIRAPIGMKDHASPNALPAAAAAPPPSGNRPAQLEVVRDDQGDGRHHQGHRRQQQAEIPVQSAKGCLDGVGDRRHRVRHHRVGERPSSASRDRPPLRFRRPWLRWISRHHPALLTDPADPQHAPAADRSHRTGPDREGMTSTRGGGRAARSGVPVRVGWQPERQMTHDGVLRAPGMGPYIWAPYRSLIGAAVRPCRKMLRTMARPPPGPPQRRPGSRSRP